MSDPAETRKCKKCKRTIIHILVGRFGTNNKDKKYVNNEGKMWNGLLCPLCNKKRARSSMKKSRYKKKLEQPINAD